MISAELTPLRLSSLMILSSPRTRGPITTGSGIWVPACAGTTSSLLRLGSLSCSPHRWPPFFEPPLAGVEQRDHDQPGRHEDQHAEEYDVGLEGIAGVRDEMAQPRGRGVELAHHDAEQRAAGAVFQAREDEWHGAGQHD